MDKILFAHLYLIRYYQIHDLNIQKHLYSIFLTKLSHEEEKNWKLSIKANL